jgi:orotate phosphoribosyltransferase
MRDPNLVWRADIPRDHADELRELARDLVQAAHLRGDFLLSAGNRSTYYFDKYLFETKPAILRRLGRFLAELVPPDTDRLAAPELGAILLGGAVSMEIGLPLVLVKKEARQYSTAHVIEGELHPAEKVCLLDDVVTTGTQAIRAARKLAEAGAVVNSVVVVLDREEGGGEAMAESGLWYRPLFRRRDLALG